ncbi:CU044_5270 family protein [Streptomyces sp. NPDC060209]|uniref:CU044_5270 family protein n=1 Tax=Streptomyces sp. NPDC060209 TaxID=3347073 RepID=UPI0036540742
MDDLTALRELEADVPAPSDEARTAARARLTRAIAEETGRTRSRAVPRRLVLRAGFAAAAAVAAAGTVVVVTDRRSGDGAPRMTTLSAAQVLHRAADRTRADGAGMPVPRDDQYFYTEEIATRTPLEGGKPTTRTDKIWLSVDGSRPSRYVYGERVQEEPPLTEHEVRWPPTEYAELKKLPTDPDRLLEALGHGDDGTDRMSAYMDLCLLLRGPGAMPPGLQAAAFEALAKLPGIVLDDDEVDALGRHGVGVSYPEMTFGPVFERGSCAYLGMRLDGVKGGRWVGRELKGGEKYVEVRGRVKSGVVDEIGQRPR